MAFRCLPEYIVEDIVDCFHFAVQTSPDKVELAGKMELLVFILTFLTSTWYIKNPFLKSKINDVSRVHVETTSTSLLTRICRLWLCQLGATVERDTVSWGI